MLILVGIHNGGTEQLAGIVLVFLAVVFRQQVLVRLVLLFKALDGFQHEGVHHLLVVVPVEALLFQQCVQIVVVLDECAV